MSIQLTFQFTDTDEAAEFLRLVGPRPAPANDPVPVTPAAPAPVAPKDTPEPIKTRRGRPPRAAEPVAPSPTAPQMDAVLGSGKVTIDNVRMALSRLNESKGLPEAKKVLAKFGAERVSAVKPEQYADFVLACEDAAK